jgi:hypothetical protein
VAAAFGWACYRFLVLPLAARFHDVDLARRVERRFPALGDRLASAVEFLEQSEDDPLAGSVALRRAVIAQATAESQRLDFQAAVEPGPTRRAAAAALSVGVVAATVLLVSPSACGIALARLANPFGQTAWPQTTHLALRTVVDRVAKGQAFEVEVVDQFGAGLPSEVRMHYRFEDDEGRVTEETQRMRAPGGVVVARRDNVTRPFSYRAEGGDDDSMPWIPVEVLEPPAVASLAVTLTPPRYTGWPAEQAGGHVRALVGTKVEISAAATKPLLSAALCLEDGRRVPGAVAADGLSFTVPAAGSEPPLIDKSGGYWFELVDTEQLTAGQEPRWEILALPDAPPTVTIEKPTATVFVTPEAVVPLRVAVKDDLAVHSVALEFERSDDSQQKPAVVTLDEGPPGPEPAAGLAAAESGSGRVVEHDWQLASLALAPGTQLTFRATATDYLPQTGASEPRRVVVITPEELADRIASRQAFILSELARVLEMQRTSRAAVSVIEIRLSEIGLLEQLDLDHLQGAELTQRQVTRSLTSPSEGVPMHIMGLLADLENNKIDSPDVRRRMEELLGEIRRLERDDLPVVARELTAAIKAVTVRLQEPAETQLDADSAAKPMSAAGRGQDQVIAALERMLGELARWDDFRRFHRDVGQLLRDQEELARRSAELARRTLTRELKDLPPQDVADLKIAGRDQFEIARRLERIQQEMQASVSQLDQSDPLAAETLSDAVHRSVELAVGGTMRSAGDDLQRNRMGQATAAQKKALDDLREVLDILANRRENELARLVRKLREAEADLADLARRQGDLKTRLDEAAAQPDDERESRLQRLAADQKQVQDETERIERRLQRLTADKAAQNAGQAADKMQSAGEVAEKDDAGQAGREADEAQKKLEEARQELEQKRRQAEIELAYEQMTRLQDTLTAVRSRQEKVIEETARLDGLKQSQGRLSDAQSATLGQLAGEQRLLGDETGGLVDDLAGAEVLRLALSDARDSMSRAAAMLDRNQTGPPTLALEKAAIVRLDQLLEAIRPEEPEEGSSDSGGGEGQGGQPQGSPGDALHALAELKLLKLLQEEVNLRTRKLEEQFGGAPNVPEDARREYSELSRQQGRLADLLLNLLTPAEDPESNPDALPGDRMRQSPPLDEEKSP